MPPSPRDAALFVGEALAEKCEDRCLLGLQLTDPFGERAVRLFSGLAQKIAFRYASMTLGWT